MFILKKNNQTPSKNCLHTYQIFANIRNTVIGTYTVIRFQIVSAIMMHLCYMFVVCFKGGMDTGLAPIPPLPEGRVRICRNPQSREFPLHDYSG